MAVDAPITPSPGAKRDARFVTFLLIAIYLLLLVVSHVRFGSYAAVGKYLGFHPQPYFADLQILLDGIDAMRAHEDPYAAISLEIDAFYNYPKIWGVLTLLPFITAKYFVITGVVLAILYGTAVYVLMGRVTRGEALMYAALVLSPALVLGVERGNCDVLLFVLIVLAVVLETRPPVFGSVVVVAGMFKLFPIGALMPCFRASPVSANLRKTYLWVLVAVFLGYVILMRENLAVVSHRTPRPFSEICYGLGSIPSLLIANFGFDRAVVFGLFGLVLVMAYAWFQARFQHEFGRLVVNKGRVGTAFLAGAGIYVVTCLIGYNWEYRLMFLLLTLPQLLQWRRRGGEVAQAMLALTVVIAWQSFIELFVGAAGLKKEAYHAISQILVIALFFSHVRLLVQTLLCPARAIPAAHATAVAP